MIPTQINESLFWIYLSFNNLLYIQCSIIQRVNDYSNLIYTYRDLIVLHSALESHCRCACGAGHRGASTAPSWPILLQYPLVPPVILKTDSTAPSSSSVSFSTGELVSAEKSPVQTNGRMGECSATPLTRRNIHTYIPVHTVEHSAGTHVSN